VYISKEEYNYLFRIHKYTRGTAAALDGVVRLECEAKKTHPGLSGWAQTIVTIMVAHSEACRYQYSRQDLGDEV